MVLGAQRVGELADDVELAADRLELGAVADRDDGADGAAVAAGRRRTDDEGVAADDVEVVGLGALADGRLDERRREPEVGDRPALAVRGQLQEAAGLLVRQLDPMVGVEEQEPLADGVEDGLVDSYIRVSSGGSARGSAGAGAAR